ncbi:phage tail protein [Pseudomonas atacamensis]|uniref:phage tail protein n=1 Tax=Pseudomonas atacamensis TaxID=2565368 RepID=UPI002160BF45|nr:phage tail protein [Pseudomonas atacamensis]UVL97951.1 phage tail protein [Pseudomonas atacamensis]
MIDANSQFFAILTNVGMAKQANADALGIPWLITQMGVGDANGTEPIPSASQTKLINEWRRKPLNQLKIDPVNPAVIIAEQIIPADEGGKWIREIGLYDADGDLVAVANCAPSFKPLLSQGSGRTQIVRMNFIVTSTGNIQLKIDPAIVLASRAYVDAAILEVLPKNKTPGEYTRVKVNDRGIVVSGDSPETLAGLGIKDSYTKPEVDAIIAQASALPVGATVAFPLNKVAPGFLELDGSVKSIATYPDLAAFLGTAFNKGDEGAGNFRLPESRAEFLRGWDHGRGVDAGRAVGSYQAEEIREHMHYMAARYAGGSGTSVAATVQLGFSGQPETNSKTSGVEALNGDAMGGVETRPRNLAVMWCIKAWNAPINQGNIDIAALAALATQATEIKLGTAKIATQALTDSGADDATIVTPKKLRWGFQILKAANGYIMFPSWLGGLVIQWGFGSAGGGGTSFSNAFSVAFPKAVHAVVAQHLGTDSSVNVISDSVSGLVSLERFGLRSNFASNVAVMWIAIGQ